MHRPIALLLATALAAPVAACGTAKPGGMSGPTMSGRMEEEERHYLVSTEILDREPLANEAKVKHILIGWKDLEDNYPGRMDPRAKERSRRDAEELVEELYERATGEEPFEALMIEYSEDRGSAGGDAIEVTPSATLVLEFRQLGLRLKVGEIGIVLTSYGFHIMKRVA